MTNVPAPLGDVYGIAAGFDHALALTYWHVLSYPVNVSRDLLLIYNTNSTDSVNVKNYYLAHRQMVSDANVLGVGCPAVEIYTSSPAFTNDLVTPVLNWLTNDPTKHPQYYILFLDIPSRIEDSAHPATGGVSVSLSSAVPIRKPFINCINMNGTNDCRGYIYKLEFIGTNYSPGKLLIQATAGGYGNSNYFLDNVRDSQFAGDVSFFFTMATNGLLDAGVSTNSIHYAEGIEYLGTNGLYSNPLPHLTNGTGVAGYICWGQHSSLWVDYPTNGAVKWSGQSRWWIIDTIESYNGQRVQLVGQGNFIKWFSPGAFGGTNYENTPVGAISYVEEPHLSGLSDAYSYFNLWASGKGFGISAWQSRISVHPESWCLTL